MFISLCKAIFVLLDLFCNLIYPGFQTLYIMLHYRKYDKMESEARKIDESQPDKERREAEYKIV